MDNVTLTPQMMAAIPGIMFVVQALKLHPIIAKLGDWTPFLSMGCGIVWAYLIKAEPTLSAQVVQGILVGLAASGGYASLKNLGNSSTPPTTK